MFVVVANGLTFSSPNEPKFNSSDAYPAGSDVGSVYRFLHLSGPVCDLTQPTVHRSHSEGIINGPSSPHRSVTSVLIVMVDDEQANSKPLTS